MITADCTVSVIQILDDTDAASRILGAELRTVLSATTMFIAQRFSALAPLRHTDRIEQYPLSGVTRKTLLALSSSQFDPSATLAGSKFRSAAVSYATVVCAILDTGSTWASSALSIQNNSGLSQGLAGRSAAGSACGKPTNGAKARGTPDVWHKAARVHIVYRGCGDSLAARGPRAAARKAGADWISVIQLPARHLS